MLWNFFGAMPNHVDLLRGFWSVWHAGSSRQSPRLILSACFPKVVKRNFLLQRNRLPFTPVAFPVCRSDVISGSRQRTMGSVLVYTSSGSSFRNKIKLPLLAARCLNEVFVNSPNLNFTVPEWTTPGICDCDEPRREFFFPFCPISWLVASTPRCCVGHLLYNIFIIMAASEGDHRVQKSAAAAQRPPHLKALEVFAARV